MFAALIAMRGAGREVERQLVVEERGRRRFGYLRGKWWREKGGSSDGRLAAI
jgi:hypothetical protein